MSSSCQGKKKFSSAKVFQLLGHPHYSFCRLTYLSLLLSLNSVCKSEVGISGLGLPEKHFVGNSGRTIYVYILIFDETTRENNGVPSSTILTVFQRSECGGLVRSMGFIHWELWVQVIAPPFFQPWPNLLYAKFHYTLLKPHCNWPAHSKFKSFASLYKALSHTLFYLFYSTTYEGGRTNIIIHILQGKQSEVQNVNCPSLQWKFGIEI